MTRAAGRLVPVPPPGPHGGDGAALARALRIPVGEVLDLSMSLNPAASDPRPALARHLDCASRYPEPEGARAALADAIGVDPGRILLTNGGAEAIALVAAEMPEGWVEDPEFCLYRRHLRRVRRGAPRWRSNPHNPTGTLAGPSERAAVWDEAFYPLATGRWTRGDTDAVVVGSLTKLLACPGLRAGYVLAPDPRLVERLASRQPRWSVNALAAAALADLLSDVDLPGWASTVAGLRADLVRVLRSAGLAVTAADAPWVLVSGAPGLRAQLAGSAILVRDCTTLGLPGVLRIAVPGDAGLARVEAALGGLGSSGAEGGEAVAVEVPGSEVAAT